MTCLPALTLTSLLTAPIASLVSSRDHDELYWNVTGNAWKFPIDVATATVLLPPNVRSRGNET